MNFVQTPYLPKKKVCLALSGAAIENIETIEPCKKLRLPENLKGHADLSFCYLGDGTAVCAPGSGEYYNEKFKHTGLSVKEGEISPDRHYPKDAAYNVAIVGRKMFCRIDITDKILLNEAEKLGYEIININQGYGKCSVCPISENSAISADKSFAKSAEKAGVEVLLITNSTILLPGYSNGFFGGCAFMADEKTLCVKGDITTHPDYLKIWEFTKKKGIDIISLGGGNLFDFGSLIPVLEE